VQRRRPRIPACRPPLVASGAIAVGVGASALLLSRQLSWLGALALGVCTPAATFVANRYREMPRGWARFMTANAFIEHLGLARAWLLAALTRQHEASP
jgi:uncharacterized membrane protein YphA (DoxX/SURF4 family)